MRLLALTGFTFSAVVALTRPLSAQDWKRRCADVAERANVGALRSSTSADSVANWVVLRWVPRLTIVRAVGLENGVPEPDQRADSLQNELDELARRDTAGFRDLMLAVLRAGAQRTIPELAVNEAAVWYRHKDGHAGPVLATLAGAPSDTWLAPLSAINSTLTVAEEDVVARIACDVALPLVERGQPAWSRRASRVVSSWSGWIAPSASCGMRNGLSMDPDER